MTTTPTIDVAGLTKSYGDHAVLRGADLSVSSGTIFALLGSNGAGKTTAVKILSTLLKADGGTAAVNGYDVAAQPAKVRESISLTGQFAAVDEILTGRENLVLIAQLRRLKDPGRIADGLLARFALTDAAGRRVATYSGGMRRRLDIAMSLIGDPPVLFLDEPTTGLDPQSRIEVWKTVQELAGQGTTVLLRDAALGRPPEDRHDSRSDGRGQRRRLCRHHRAGERRRCLPTQPGAPRPRSRRRPSSPTPWRSAAATTCGAHPAAEQATARSPAPRRSW